MKRLPALLPLIGALSFACAIQGSAVQGGDAGSNQQDTARSAQSPFTGTWRLFREPPQARPGFSIEVAFDSVSGGIVFGKLLSFFSGNVGIDPRGYRPFYARLSEDSLFGFTIYPTDSSSARELFFSGLFQSDTLALRQFAVGMDTVRAGGVRWLLVKQK